MAAIRLAAVSLDSDDPGALAAFWRELLGLTVMFESRDFVALEGAGILLTTQHVPEHRSPDWPDGATPKQLHLELAVDELDASRSARSPSAPAGRTCSLHRSVGGCCSTPQVTPSASPP